MEKKQSNKGMIWLYLLLIVAGCVLACSTLIPNMYANLVVVMACFCVGLYGVLKALGGSGEKDTNEKLERHENK